MPTVEHVFVLMFENRSFDHLFGFSGLSGTDAATGGHTVIDGLSGSESNTFGSKAYPVTRGADYAMPVDPGHEFPNVLDQLCGPGVPYVAPYPPIAGSGFVDSYNASGGSANPAEVMKCFDTPRQLPVFYALAQEYAICDHWFSSLPGPTWPNRLFVHAATSSGLDHSPSTAEIVLWETLDGFSFKNGSVFDALKKAGKTYQLYSGDEFPMVAALKGVELGDVHRITDLVAALKSASFSYNYVFIEPSYNLLQDYRSSSSMHPLADVRDGEALVKQIYEALRASSIWEQSLLLVLWDEHGGFYDHVTPPPAIAPGDTAPHAKNNEYGFTFERYGVRTPALVVSPFVPKGTIDHRTYDHSSVLAALREADFRIAPLTARDSRALSPLSLLSLQAPRTADADARMTLPAPVSTPTIARAATPGPMALIGQAPVAVTRAEDSVDAGLLPAILQSAMHQDILMNPGNKNDILKRVAGLSTRADAVSYLAEVQERLRARASAAALPASTVSGSPAPATRG